MMTMRFKIKISFIVRKTYFKNIENGVQLLPLWFIPCKTENNIVCHKYTGWDRRQNHAAVIQLKSKMLHLVYFSSPLSNIKRARCFQTSVPLSLDYKWGTTRVPDLQSIVLVLISKQMAIPTDVSSTLRFVLCISDKCFSGTDICLIVGWRTSKQDERIRI